MNLTDKYVDYLYSLYSKEFPHNIIEKAKECVIDYLGVVYAGACDLTKSEHIIDYLARIKSSSGKCSAIGLDFKTNVAEAAFINGMNAHIMELDDGHRFGAIHLGAVIISAVFAAAQNDNISGIDILKGIIIGYEAAVKLAILMQPSHKLKGFHTTGTCGTIGAAVGVAIALRMSKEQLKSVISAAATSAAGLLEIQEDGSELKPYNVGRAAMDGVMAAYIGFTFQKGPDDILGSSGGFINVFSDNAMTEKAFDESTYFEIERIYIKPYAACRHCHSAIEAALSLRDKIDYNCIERIEIYTYKLAVKGHDHKLIQGASSAKLSMPYSVAAALVYGNCSPDIYDESSLCDNNVAQLSDKVFIYEKDAYTQMCPKKRAAEVRIFSKSGEVYIKNTDYAKGEPENPMNHSEIADKYFSLMKRANKSNIMDSIIHVVENIECKYGELWRML